MSEKRFSLKEWEDLNYYEHCFYDGENQLSDSDVVVLLNDQQAIIRRDETSIKTMMSNMEKLEKENEKLRKENFFLAYWKRKAMILLMQVRRLTPRMTDKEVREFARELDDE